MSNKLLKRVADFVFLLVRAVLKPERARRLGLTPIFDERHDAALKHIRGNLLDIGCGTNVLVRRYGEGVGVDVHPGKGIDALVDTARLPFARDTFDTVTFLASLNPIPVPARNKAVDEVRRVLKDDGQTSITMITPVPFCAPGGRADE